MQRGRDSARVQAVKQLAESMGGSVESMYFVFGGDDFFITVDLPDAPAVADVLAPRQLSPSS